MRIFVTVLILILSVQCWTKADDIGDYEIEGMSVGDSLLKFYSKNEIQTQEEKGKDVASDKKPEEKKPAEKKPAEKK